MTAVKHYCFWVCLLTFSLPGCNSQPSDAVPTETDTRFDENKLLFAAIKDADAVVVYEGLPRNTAAKGGLSRTVTLHGFHFYAATLTVSPDDLTQLKGYLADERSFLQWRGEKKCGGFHPDYLAEYSSGTAKYRVLICLGCHEVMVFGPDHSLRCDIQGDAYKQIESLLTKYGKKS